MEKEDKQSTYTTLSPKDFANNIKSSDIYLIDVRHADEYKTGHIENAVNDDVLAPNFVDFSEKILPVNKTIAVYCGTGKRSAAASEKLSALGYKVLNLEGGLQAWKAEGLPTV